MNLRPLALLCLPFAALADDSLHFSNAPGGEPSIFTANGGASASPRWQGFYAGVAGGYAAGHTAVSVAGYPSGRWAEAPAVPAAYGSVSAGGLAGILAGYNGQIGQYVIGIEADASNARGSGSATASGTTARRGTPFVFTASQRMDSILSLRARAGLIVDEHLLVYGTAGVARGTVNTSTRLAFPRVSYLGNDTRSRVGWIAGIGADYALNERWSAQLEYLHYDLGQATEIGYPSPAHPPYATHSEFTLAGDLYRIGFNYRFGESGGAPTQDGELGAPAVHSRIGLRYWSSRGKTAKRLQNIAGTTEVSRLTFAALDAHAGELFFRGDHASGLFIKGFVGTGRIAGGHLTDEDFPPVTLPYSSTVSLQKNGSIDYANADIGIRLLDTQSYRLGGFVGYHYDHEILNLFGCSQTAAHALGCAPPLPEGTPAISNDATWRSLRLGVTAEADLGEALTLTADAAYLPYTRLDNRDSHWLRIGRPGGFTGAIPADGVGHHGLQLETALEYRMTRGLSVGAGLRYWRAEAHGYEHFDGHIFAGRGRPQPVAYRMERYGSFLQLAYKF